MRTLFAEYVELSVVRTDAVATNPMNGVTLLLDRYPRTNLMHDESHLNYMYHVHCTIIHQGDI